MDTGEPEAGCFLPCGSITLFLYFFHSQVVSLKINWDTVNALLRTMSEILQEEVVQEKKKQERVGGWGQRKAILLSQLGLQRDQWSHTDGEQVCESRAKENSLGSWHPVCFWKTAKQGSLVEEERKGSPGKIFLFHSCLLAYFVKKKKKASTIIWFADENKLLQGMASRSWRRWNCAHCWLHRNSIEKLHCCCSELRLGGTWLSGFLELTCSEDLGTLPQMTVHKSMSSGYCSLDEDLEECFFTAKTTLFRNPQSKLAAKVTRLYSV